MLTQVFQTAPLLFFESEQGSTIPLETDPDEIVVTVQPVKLCVNELDD